MKTRPVFNFDEAKHVAPRWKMMLARLFGERREDENLVSYWWRGKLYVSKVKRP